MQETYDEAAESQNNDLCQELPGDVGTSLQPRAEARKASLVFSPSPFGAASGGLDASQAPTTRSCHWNERMKQWACVLPPKFASTGPPECICTYGEENLH